MPVMVSGRCRVLRPLPCLAQDPGVDLVYSIEAETSPSARGQTSAEVAAAYLSVRCSAGAVLCALPVAELSDSSALHSFIEAHSIWPIYTRVTVGGCSGKSQVLKTTLAAARHGHGGGGICFRKSFQHEGSA